MADPQEITDLRKRLGRALAEYRKSAGLRQEDLAPLMSYGRSTIANVETGRQNVPRRFWENADDRLHADGALLAAYDALQARYTTFRKQQAHAFQRDDTMLQQWNQGGLAADDKSDGPDTVELRMRLDGTEVVMPLSRRHLLLSGISSFAEVFALGAQPDMLHETVAQRKQADRLAFSSPVHMHEVVGHLQQQWHALVKTDNLLGPRFALAGVLNQIAAMEGLLAVLRDNQRLELVRLGAKYAESAAWLYEDAGNIAQVRRWTSRALEWAYEGDDERMLAWAIFRRSQQASAIPDAAQVIGLAQAARRNEAVLARPTRAAIRVQEAHGYALDGDEQTSQRLLDEAHNWAASDTKGDAHQGHGSYCTPSYIEIQRGTCWLSLGKPKKAIALYKEGLRALPSVYQRNRAAALSQLAAAYVADRQFEQGASTARAALPAARSAGSSRIVEEIKGVGAKLAPLRALEPVAALLEDLGEDV